MQMHLNLAKTWGNDLHTNKFYYKEQNVTLTFKVKAQDHNTDHGFLQSVPPR